MRLLCLQENLNKGLSIVSRAVPSRTTLPVTQNVLITTDNGKIKLDELITDYRPLDQI